MRPRHDVLWTCDALRSAEHGVLEGTEEGGWRLRGWTVLPIGDDPGRIEHVVRIDEAWRTRAATIDVHTDQRRSWDVRVDGGAWTIDGAARPDLDGCTDIDLGWSPSTNTLPVRRLGLDVGEEAITEAAWFRFPELVIERSVQRYQRTGERSWRYRSGPYDFDLEVDAHGIVVRYGEDLWQAVAPSSGSGPA